MNFQKANFQVFHVAHVIDRHGRRIFHDIHCVGQIRFNRARFASRTHMCAVFQRFFTRMGKYITGSDISSG
jgi:hypothetical protein